LLTDANGVPIVFTLTGANRHDSTQLLTLVNRVPSIRGKRGAPRYRFDKLVADRAYDCEADREALRSIGTTPFLARRNTEHGSGLGQWRWVGSIVKSCGLGR